MKSCCHKTYRHLILSWFRTGGGDLIGRRRGTQRQGEADRQKSLWLEKAASPRNRDASPDEVHPHRAENIPPILLRSALQRAASATGKKGHQNCKSRGSSCPQNDTLCRGNRCAVCHNSSEEVGEARRTSHVGSHVSTANAATRQTLEVLRAGKSSLSYPGVCADRHCIGCRPDRSRHCVATYGRVPLPSDLRSRRIPSAAISGGVAARQQRVHGRGTWARDGQDVENRLRSAHGRPVPNPRRNADGHNARSAAITGW